MAGKRKSCVHVQNIPSTTHEYIPLTQKQTLIRMGILAVVAAAVMLVALFVPSFRQPQQYHNFADQRVCLLAVPHCGDVLSNIPFLFVGVSGWLLAFDKSKRRCVMTFWQWLALMFLSIGLIGTAFGSAYYHWSPNDSRLLWDRIPMAIALSAVLAGSVGERVSGAFGPIMVILVPLMGIICTMWWRVTNDLRLYAGFQAACVLLYGGVLCLFPSPYTHEYAGYIPLLLFALARLFEILDHMTWLLTLHFVSGHTLKHLLAAAAGQFLVHGVQYRNLKKVANSVTIQQH